MKTEQLWLTTAAFGIAFALWGSLGGAAPILKEAWRLTPLETGFLVSLPVVLGSLGRIPMGILTDRWGARLVMSSVLSFSGVCALAIAFFEVNYGSLLALAALLGVAGTAFAVGVAHLAPWYPKQERGAALGIFGMGNLGQSAAVFGVPWLAGLVSWKFAFGVLGILGLAWSVLYFLKAEEARAPVSPHLRGDRHSSAPKVRGKKLLSPLFRSREAWLFSTYYFLTFGGFVALAVYLPTLFRDEFQLSPEEAGLRVAGFVVLATFARPLGGFLSDQVQARRVLFLVFLGISLSTILLMSNALDLFLVGAFGFGLCAGLGNGAVFKLVASEFPEEAGTVGGLVGAVGGMGGFFPPLLMSWSLETFGNYSLGWLGLLSYSVFCAVVLWRSAPSLRAPRSGAKQSTNLEIASSPRPSGGAPRNDGSVEVRL